MVDGSQPDIVRVPSQLDHDVGLAPHELEDRDSRVQLLKGHFLDIANGTHTPHTVEYIRGGGSLRLCLTEIMALSEPCEQDQQIQSIRSAYMETALQKRGFLRRKARKEQLRATEEVYVGAVVAKITAVIDAHTPEEAMTLGQMPTLVERASFAEGEELKEDDLAANHLYLLVDTALKEHVHRRHAVERHQGEGRLSRLAGNRALNLSVAGTVFAAAVTPRLGVLPTHGELLAQNLELGLRVLSGTILGLSAPEAARLKYLQVKHDRRTGELQEELAGDKQLADRALRMTYNSTRYGNLDGTGRVTGRSGTEDKDENLRRFARLDREFPHLNNDPGGKPYTGEQALGYAARLLIEREDQLKEITDKGKPPAERKELFLELVKDILVEDVIRMKKGLNVSRFRRRVVNTLAVIPAFLFPQAASTVNEATALSRGAAGALEGKPEVK
jgi:hypothetical protein